MRIERLKFFGKRDVRNFCFLYGHRQLQKNLSPRGVPNVKGLPTRKTRLIRRNLKMDFSSKLLARTPYFFLPNSFFSSLIGFNVNSPTHKLLAQFNRYPPPPPSNTLILNINNIYVNLYHLRTVPNGVRRLHSTYFMLVIQMRAIRYCYLFSSGHNSE